MRRSAAAPLILRLNAERDSEDDRCISAGVIFSGSINRIRKLSINVHGIAAYMCLIDTLMRGQAPLLEYLRVDKDTDTGPFLFWDGKQPKSPVLFEGHTPKLRKLRIEATDIFPLNAPLFSSVTYLRMGLGNGHLPENLLSALENWKQLQTLILSHTLRDKYNPRLRDPLPALIHSVELPNLRLLRVHESYPCIQRFFHHLVLPASTLLDVNSPMSLRIEDSSSGNPQVVRFIRNLLSSMPSNIMSLMTSLYLHPPKTSFLIDARPELWDENIVPSMLDQPQDPDEDDDLDDAVDGPFTTKLRICVPLYRNFFLAHEAEQRIRRNIACEDYFKALFAGRHFSGLRDLTLDGCFSYSVHMWIEVFDILNGLQRLSMTAAEHHTTDELVKTLDVQLVSRHGAGGCLVLPNLASLTLSQPTRPHISAQRNLLKVLDFRHSHSSSRLAELRVSNVEDFEEEILVGLRDHAVIVCSRLQSDS
ncbi:hypothetical protein DENSPDRAFT_839098 [Dentipellis sp. KUC8613]|nr:hypothetical protein DENSPDRAFT_839098 [Dentipellis sp. KUC8613]